MSNLLPVSLQVRNDRVAGQLPFGACSAVRIRGHRERPVVRCVSINGTEFQQPPSAVDCARVTCWSPGGWGRPSRCCWCFLRPPFSRRRPQTQATPCGRAVRLPANLTWTAPRRRGAAAGAFNGRGGYGEASNP